MADLLKKLFPFQSEFSQWMGENEKANKKLAKTRLKREIQKEIQEELRS